jgi:hypothetical protein
VTDLAETIKLISDLGPTGATVIIFAWFAKWLPKHLDKQLGVFQAEMATERARCDKLIQDLRDDYNDQRAEILRAVRERSP